MFLDSDFGSDTNSIQVSLANRINVKGGLFMSRVARLIGVLTLVICLPASARAQGVSASITGTVKDVSGAVLPGVTVEVASPALIEKTRTAVTDGSGQ